MITVENTIGIQRSRRNNVFMASPFSIAQKIHEHVFTNIEQKDIPRIQGRRAHYDNHRVIMVNVYIPCNPRENFL